MILGAGGMGKAAMEAFLSNDVVIYGFLDEDETLTGREIGDIAVLGQMDDSGLLGVIGKDCEAFVATEEVELRKNLVEMLTKERKVMPVNAIHKQAQLATTVVLGHGNYIGPLASLGAFARLGSHGNIQAGAIINHEARLGDYVQVGSGAVIGAGAQLADEVFVGSGAIVVAGVKVGAGARIGAGSVVVQDVKEGETVFGNPAQPV